MQTILLICDDEARRAELHGLLSPNFKVFATEHKDSESLKKKMTKENKVLVLESEDGENNSTRDKITLYPIEKNNDSVLERIIRSVFNKN